MARAEELDGKARFPQKLMFGCPRRNVAAERYCSRCASESYFGPRLQPPKRDLRYNGEPNNVGRSGEDYAHFFASGMGRPVSLSPPCGVSYLHKFPPGQNKSGNKDKSRCHNIPIFCKLGTCRTAADR
eukprot:gene9036-biopygen13725